VFRRLLSGRSRLLARATVLSMFAVLLAFAVYPHGETGRVQDSDEWSIKLKMNPRTAAIFSHSCADCHSNRTVWPWYSRVPPASWLITHDIVEARKNFNASLWSTYSVAAKREILGNIARVITNREMPVQQYLLLHRTARLSDRDGASLLEWATGQRRLLRKMDAQELSIESLRETPAR
jgi:heme-binding protein